MNVAQFIRTRITKAAAEMDRIAHQTMAEARSYEAYLVNMGKYRQLKSERDSLEASLKSMQAADDRPDIESGNLTPEEDDEIELQQPRTRSTKLRRATPRSWGGR
jgi:uncharacterized protein (DUF3084 family)